MDHIETRMILEIMGRPAEHIAKTMHLVLEKLGAEKGTLIKEKRVHEPAEVKDAKNLFTTFAEVEAEFDSLESYLNVIFGYMPANIEIISPEKFNLTNQQATYLGNLVVTRLHFYDSVAKQLLAEKEIISNQLKHVMAGGKINREEMNAKKQKSALKKRKKY